MKKSIMYLAAAAALTVGITACGNKADKEQADTTAQPEMAAEEMQAPQEPTVPDSVDVVVEEIDVVEEVAAPEAVAPKGDGYTTTASGLKYKVLKKGNGKKPKATDTVLVNYEGKLTDGTIFDSSYQRGEPISFPLNRVIPGWTEGVQLMPEGSVYEFYIPYNLAYGERGSGPIPPKSDLIFKVELIKVQ